MLGTQGPAETLGRSSSEEGQGGGRPGTLRARTGGGGLRPSETPLRERWPLLSTTVKTTEPPDFSRKFPATFRQLSPILGSLWCRLSAASPGERGKLSAGGRCGVTGESEGWSDAREGPARGGEGLATPSHILRLPPPPPPPPHPRSWERRVQSGQGLGLNPEPVFRIPSPLCMDTTDILNTKM